MTEAVFLCIFKKYDQKKIFYMMTDGFDVLPVALFSCINVHASVNDFYCMTSFRAKTVDDRSKMEEVARATSEPWLFFFFLIQKNQRRYGSTVGFYWIFFCFYG